MHTAIIAALLLQASVYAMPGEDKVDPYTPSAANADGTPYDGTGLAEAFHGQAGIRRIVDRTLSDAYADPVVGEIFKSHDRVRLDRTLSEQICYLLNAGCTYSGRDMATAHKDLGIQRADMNRVVEILQQAMTAEGVPFQAQNRLLAKLAPMHHDIVGK